MPRFVLYAGSLLAAVAAAAAPPPPAVVIDDLLAPPSAGTIAMMKPVRRRRALDHPPRRRLETYSWGPAKQYSVDWSADHSHTLGGKTAVITRYSLTGEADCGNPCVISDADLDEIVQAGDEFIRANSYGKTWLEKVDYAPNVKVQPGNFFEEIDRVREAVHASNATFDFDNYDFDLVWKDKGSGAAGGSAIPGGRSQRFSYDSGSKESFKSKIFPHEFTHNFGVGHAWQGGSTYGDNYDMLGGGSGPDAHVSAAVKHRFNWITDNEVEVLQPAGLSAAREIKLWPFDAANSMSTLPLGHKLAVRLDTRFMSKECPKGSVDWCPDWGTENNAAYGNPWVDMTAEKSDHFLYVSYRGAVEGADGSAGASLHISKHFPNGWVAATSFIDVRPLTATQTDAFLLPGETYVFDGDSSTAIAITVMSLSHHELGDAYKTLTVRVEYLDGKKAADGYIKEHEKRLCATGTLSCGKEIPVVLSSVPDPSRTDGRAITAVRVGEMHNTEVQLGICSHKADPPVEVFAYDRFPVEPLLYASPLLIGASATLPDLCAKSASKFPPVISISGTGEEFLDGSEFKFLDMSMQQYSIPGNDGIPKVTTITDTLWPHYFAPMTGFGYPAHLQLVDCQLWYCLKPSGDTGYDVWGAGPNAPVTGFQWVLSMDTGSGAGTGTSWQPEYFAPLDEERKNIVNPLDLAAAGVVWRKAQGGSYSSVLLDLGPTKMVAANSTREQFGQFGSGFKWLVLAQNASNASISPSPSPARTTVNIVLSACTVNTCGPGFFRNSEGNGCSATCKKCDPGQIGLPGYERCYHEAESLLVNITNDPTNDKNGIYVKVGGADALHEGKPYYMKEDGNYMLRADRFSHWCITRDLALSTSGCGYNRDLKMPDVCQIRNCADAPFPQLWPGLPCDACNKSIPWKCSDNGQDCNPLPIVSIEEVGPPPISNSTTSSSSNCSCSSEDHSQGGKPTEPCAGGRRTESKTGLCTWMENSNSPETSGDDVLTPSPSADTSTPSPSAGGGASKENIGHPSPVESEENTTTISDSVSGNKGNRHGASIATIVLGLVGLLVQPAAFHY